MTKPEQIQTREHLIAVVERLLQNHYDPDMEEFRIIDCAVAIVDLIADLPNMCFHYEK